MVKKRVHRQEGMLLLLPYLTFYLGFTILPVIWSFYLSLYSGGFIGGLVFNGFNNYVNAWKDEVFVKTIKNTGYYVGAVVPSVMAFSLFIAVLINKMKKGQNFVKACIFLPQLVAPVPLAIAWRSLFQPGMAGGFNFALNFVLKLPPQNWLGNAKLVIPAIVIFEFWRGYGWWTMIFLGGLASIPPEFYEAAKIDGANSWQQFLHITVPLLRPTFTFLTVMGIIWNFQLFDAIFMLTKGGPGYESYTMAWYVYKMGFLYDRAGLASTMGIILLGVILFLTTISRKLLEKGE